MTPHHEKSRPEAAQFAATYLFGGYLLFGGHLLFHSGGFVLLVLLRLLVLLIVLLTVVPLAHDNSPVEAVKWLRKASSKSPKTCAGPLLKLIGISRRSLGPGC
jgi:hypothetical protein